MKMKMYSAYLFLFFLSIANVINTDEFASYLREDYSNALSNSQKENEINNLENAFGYSNTNNNPDLTYQNFIQLVSNAAPKKPQTKGNLEEFNPNMILQNGENLNLVLSDWLKISSPQFKNNKRYPELLLPNGTSTKIKITPGYYRINESYSAANKKAGGPPGPHFFWFRLSGRNLYYSINKSDLNVMGTVRVKEVSNVNPTKIYSEEPLCFTVLDEQESKWKLCTQDSSTKVKWVCTMRRTLGQVDKDCEKVLLADSEITVLTRKVTQPVILIPLPQRSCNENWDYSRNGDDWECECKEGKEQSPINLPSEDSATISPVKPVFIYEEVLAKDTRPNESGEMKTDQYLKIVSENGILKIKNKYFGKIVTLDGAIYFAEEIIFHTPAEHKINGKSYDLEMQIIHTGQTKGDIAKHVVLSFLFEKRPGTYNKFIDDVDFFNLPNPTMRERDIINNLYIPKILYNSDNENLPIMKPFSFYTYQGSMTAPPCSERTIHYVAAKPIPIGGIVIQLFQEASRLPDMTDSSGNIIVNTNKSVNNRSIQPTNGRSVYYYNSVEYNGVEPPEPPRAKPEGHYEKVNKKLTEYIYINSERPSGLPGAFVVSETEAKGNI